MAKKEILDYIELCVNKGYRLDSIKNKLKKSGWTDLEIHDAIDEFTEGMEVTHPGKKPAPKPVHKTMGTPEETLPAADDFQKKQPLEHPIQKPTHSTPMPQPKPLPSQNPMDELWDREPSMGMERVEPRTQPLKPKPLSVPVPNKNTKAARMGLTVSLLGGAIAFFAGILIMLTKILGFDSGQFDVIHTLGGFVPIIGDSLTASFSTGILDMVLVFVSLALAFVVLVGASLMSHPDKTKLGGIIVIVTSAINLSLFFGVSNLGIIGAVIGLLGGVLGLLRK